MKTTRQYKSQTKSILGAILFVSSFIIISFITSEADKAADISTVEMYLVK